MTINIWLQQATLCLHNSRLSTGRLDALVLLEYVLGVDRARLLAEPDTQLSATQLTQLEKLLKRRAQHEPLAYLRNKSEFYGREFIISPAVLVPRPESETMIELLKSLVVSQDFTRELGQKSKVVRIADVGTGSGALGITAALELPNTHIDLLDISREVLQVAKHNVDKFTLSITTTVSDLLDKSSQDYDILLCNLPYVPDTYPINTAAAHEPKVAIFGGPDGLALYRHLFQQIDRLAYKPLYILTEALPAQQPALQGIAKRSHYKLIKTKDFIQLFVSH